MNKRLWIAALLLSGIIGCAHHGIPPASSIELTTPPPAPREFRAAWVATVANIDWPTKPGLSTADQQSEAIAILDKLQELNMNCAILQVRTAADALYDSKLEPWSYYLTGQQGKAPDPYYDPLKFWVDEAHKRGIELHAWFNPFRAKQDEADYELSPTHIVKTNPELTVKYGPYLWMIPTQAEARKKSAAVFLDVVKRYDVDGIHIDDYFYPYPEGDPAHKGQELQFPDSDLYAKYQTTGGKLSRDNWRRDAITQMIHSIYVETKSLKPWVKFGISPFGLPYGDTMPEGIKGFNQYEKLYADTILWLQKGWVDYWTPQLYWPIEQRPQSYPVLLDYWIAANTMHRHIWPGLGVHNVGARGPKAWKAEEALNQIELTRWRPESTGEVYFSMKVLQHDRDGLATKLKNGPYKEPALVPATPWLGGKAPKTPKMILTIGNNDELKASWQATGGGKVWQYALWVRYGSTWHFRVLPAEQMSIQLNDDKALGGPVTEVALSAVDRLGNESGQVKMVRPPAMKYPWPGLSKSDSK
ncbi:MAG TPA: family 10 glycosylhydrolase [Tepidisphaeraceae bacterium]|jgi:uncharacterized lipoprotein YddW (UPF0748 family)|nr:family 10 glycosylhydrolase [Tepidisphaeraceae bacterium]